MDVMRVTVTLGRALVTLGGVALPFVSSGIVPIALCMWSSPNVTRSIKECLEPVSVPVGL